MNCGSARQGSLCVRKDPRLFGGWRRGAMNFDIPLLVESSRQGGKSHAERRAPGANVLFRPPASMSVETVFGIVSDRSG